MRDWHYYRDNNEFVEFVALHQYSRQFMSWEICMPHATEILRAGVDDRRYADGPVTEVAYIRVEYGRFEEYIDWLNSTWKPTMVAMKKAGLIIDYKVFNVTPKSADQPNIFRMITFENMAALDKGIELEAVAKNVIGSTKVQNKARVGRNEYRTILGSELIRELILK